jgi:glyceraldehyde 3-phosphate dehydrogenase
MSAESLSLKNGYETELNTWIVQEKAANELTAIVGRLRFNRSVELIIFHKPLYDVSVSEVLNHHDYAKNIVLKPITIFDSLEVAKGLDELNLAPARIDLGQIDI